MAIRLSNLVARLSLCACTMGAGLFLAAQSHADQVDRVLQITQNKANAAKKSQTRIDSVADSTGDLLQDYRRVNKDIEGLRVFNAQLENQIGDQERRLADLEADITKVSDIRIQIAPLVNKMIDALEQFVELDMPFHLEVRQDNIRKLRENLGRSNVTSAEIFRQVLENYKIENEYGRKIDSYKDTIEIDGMERKVDVFRVGRIALLYRTEDGEKAGHWDTATRSWQALNAGEWRSALQNGLRIARKQAAINLLQVPVHAPEVFQ